MLAFQLKSLPTDQYSSSFSAGIASPHFWRGTLAVASSMKITSNYSRNLKYHTNRYDVNYGMAEESAKIHDYILVYCGVPYREKCSDDYCFFYMSVYVETSYSVLL